jgi:hypothetical protein
MAQPDRHLPRRARQRPFARQIQPPRQHHAHRLRHVTQGPAPSASGHRPAPCPRRPSPRHGARCIPCTQCRARGPVIQRLSPVAVAIRPSSVAASFRLRTGRPATDARRQEPRMIAPRLILQNARFHRDPRRAQHREPAPAVRGVGIPVATTTRATPASTSARCTGRRLAGVVARLQRHVNRRARAPRPA